MSEKFSVYLKLKPGTETAFLAASRANQVNARKEPGNRRFDIYQSTENSLNFLFLEEYDTKESIDFHRTTAHFLTWVETAGPMLVEPRQLLPGNELPAGYLER